MKKILLTLLLASSTISYAQTITYQNLGGLLSEESISGTARFNAMSGAFGALGGDLSAIDVNPAGAAVYDYSQFSASLSLKLKNTNATLGGRSLEVGNDVVAFSQAGGVFVFDENRYSVTNNNKYAFGFNYTRLRDFDNFWVASSGINGEPNLINDIFDPSRNFDLIDGKQIEVLEDGKNDKYAFTFAAKLDNKFHFGASLNIYDMEHYQSVIIDEQSTDSSNGGTLDTNLLQEQFNRGNGVSLALGMIAHPIKNLRVGISYQSPVWYNLEEDFAAYDIEVFENGIFTQDPISFIDTFDYKLRTPSKITTSLAYVFGDKGLISADYTFKDFSKIQLSGSSDFIEFNNDFSRNFDGYNVFKVGGEWRFDKLSARAGLNVADSSGGDEFINIRDRGFSLGLGYSFRGGRIDFAYQYQSSYSRTYDNYSNYEDVVIGLNDETGINNSVDFNTTNFNQTQPTSLSISNSRITTTLVINL